MTLLVAIGALLALLSVAVLTRPLWRRARVAAAAGSALPR